MSKIDDLVRQGLKQHQADRWSEAETLYQKALSRQPSHAAANHLLGVLLLQSGRAVEAVPRLERAVKMHRSAEYLGNLGTALNAAGRAADAVTAFDDALELQPASPGILNNRSMALKALYRHDEAVEGYRKAIELLPGEAGFHRNLANTLGELGDWHGAEAAYRAALAARPGFPSAVTGLCNALLALNRHADAVHEMAELAAAYPQVAEIQRAHGHALWQSGDPAGAAAAYRRAIAADSADVEAHRLLGLIVPRHAEDDETRAAESLLGRANLTVQQRTQLEFTLGRAFEDMGDADRAFAHYSRANHLVRQSTPYDLEAELSRIDAIIQFFENLPDSALPPLQPPTGPIFLVGLPRSGKTTLERMLSADPALFPGGELGLLGIVAAALANRGDRVAGTAISNDEAKALGDRYHAVCAKLASGKRVIDTMPGNVLLVGLVRQAMPDARVVFCHRPTRDHVAALHSKFYGQSGNGYAADLRDALAYVAATDRLRTAWEQRFPGFCLSVDMSILRSAGTGQWARICRHLGLRESTSMPQATESEPRLSSASNAANAGRQRLLTEIDELLALPAARP